MAGFVKVGELCRQVSDDFLELLRLPLVLSLVVVDGVLLLLQNLGDGLGNPSMLRSVSLIGYSCDFGDEVVRLGLRRANVGRNLGECAHRSRTVEVSNVLLTIGGAAVRTLWDGAAGPGGPSDLPLICAVVSALSQCRVLS
jgi:hypothetical protein